jgi:hypothetical protein
MKFSGEEMADKVEEDMKIMRITAWHRVARGRKE